MKQYAFFIVILFSFAVSIFAQPAKAREDVWQEAWEGVPEHYQKWEYPDFEFPAKLSDWKKERIGVREKLIELLGDLPRQHFRRHEDPGRVARPPGPEADTCGGGSVSEAQSRYGGRARDQCYRE